MKKFTDKETGRTYEKKLDNLWYEVIGNNLILVPLPEQDSIESKFQAQTESNTIRVEVQSFQPGTEGGTGVPPSNQSGTEGDTGVSPSNQPVTEFALTPDTPQAVSDAITAGNLESFTAPKPNTTVEFRFVKTKEGWYFYDPTTKKYNKVPDSEQSKADERYEQSKPAPTPPPPCPAESLTTGQTITHADPCKDNTLARIEAYLTNFFDKVTKVGNAVLNIGNEINFVVDLIGDTITGFTNKMLGSLNDALSGLINKGIDALTGLLISSGYRIPAIIGIEKPLIPLVQKLVDGIFCAAKKVIDGAKDAMKDLITGAVKNVLNAGQCVVEQIMGGFVNNLVNIVDSIVGPLLEPITNILNGFGKNIFGFNIKDFLLTGINAIRKIANLFDCGEKPTCPASSKYKIDQGLLKDMSEEDENSVWNTVFSGTAISQGATNLASDFERQYGKWNIFGAPVSETGGIGPCEFGNITKCGAPTVSFFGGNGVGAAGEVILGNIIDNADTEDAVGSVLKVGSIVGVNMTEPGSGYGRPPIVTFQDSCNKGYGAYGRAIIDQNPRSPTYGQVTSVIITSQGENYPADIDELPLYIEDVVIENPGQGYEDGDGISIQGFGEGFDEGFDIEITNGQVTRVSVVPGFGFNGLPDLNILSTTGFGAVLRPIMSVATPQTEIVQVIDCIS